MIYLDVTFNLTLLVALSIISGFIEKHWPRHTRQGVLLQGILFGTAAVFGMLRPLTLGPGIILDGRSLMVSLCALFFGPWAGAVAALLTMMCRIWLGGAGMITGLLVIFSSLVIGLVGHYRFNPEVKPPSATILFLFGLTVHVAMLALFFTLPGGVGLTVVMRIGLAVMMLYPLATILAGKILSDQIEAEQRKNTLRDSEDKYRLLVNSLSSGVVVHAPDSSIIFSNPMASTLLGLTSDQMRGKDAMDPAWSFLRENGMALSLAEYPVNRVLLSGGPIANHVLGICRPDLAEPVWVQCNAYPVTAAAGTLLQVVVTFSDITGLKVYEKELQQKNAELERFAYTVSHDLKSPIITIKGFTGSLEKDLAKGNYERMAGDLKRVSDAADRMNDLLRDLLELSTIGRVIKTPEVVDMNLLVADVLAQLAGPLKNHRVTVTVQPGLPTLCCDRRRMAEVVQNLLENAINYMSHQADPQIRIGMREEAGENIFFVQDNGIGIDEKYHKVIFGLFNKLDAESDGTGVGLALVKRIVEAHGGTVWVESEGEGKGSRFCFTVGS